MRYSCAGQVTYRKPGWVSEAGFGLGSCNLLRNQLLNREREHTSFGLATRGICGMLQGIPGVESSQRTGLHAVPGPEPDRSNFKPCNTEERDTFLHFYADSAGNVYTNIEQTPSKPMYAH